MQFNVGVDLAIGFHLRRLKPFWVDLKIYISMKLNLTQRKTIHNAHARVMEFAACISILCASDNEAVVFVAHSQGRETIVANVSKLMLGAAIAALSIASPALA